MSASRSGRAIRGLWPAALLLGACGGVKVPSAGCGSAACPTPQPPASVSPTAASSSSATGHGWTTTAELNAGRIAVHVTVPGPITVEDGCVPALTVWLVNATGTRIDPSPVPGPRCQAISLDVVAEGQSRTFEASLPAPAPGTYGVHGLVRGHLPIGAGARVSENIAVVSLVVH